MQLTKFTDVALRIVMRLNATGPDGDVCPSTREVAEQLAVPYSYAAKAVTKLSQLGVIDAQRGRSGGLSITEAGRDASIGWLTRQLEGDGEVVTCEGSTPCPLRGGCRLRAALRAARDAFYAALDPITVADISTAPSRGILLSLIN